MSEPVDIDNEEEEFAESTLIQAIENQIESDNPPAAKATFNKLTLVGYEREDILQMMAHVLAWRLTRSSKKTAPSTPSGMKPPCAHCQRCRQRRTEPQLRCEW